MGVIELIIIAIVIGVVVAGFSSVAITSPRRRSRVDWSKVMLVLLGIPFLLIVAVGGTYFLSQTRAQHEVALAQIEERIAQDIAASERERALRSQEIIIDTDETAPAPAAIPEYEHDFQEAHASQHQMPSHIGRLTEMASQPTLLLLALGIAVVLGFFFLLFTFLNKKVALTLTFACLGAMILLGGAFTMNVRSTGAPVIHEIREYQATTSAELKPPKLKEFEVTSSGTIPIEEEEAANPAVKPLQILERDYDFTHGTSISSKSVNRIPNWVEEALTEHVFRPDENEIVITSKRYSSIKEAEAELNKIAEMLVTDYVVGIYPEMRESWIDAEQIRRLGILEKSCEITWPFQVGEFKDKVYQVTWQLDVTSRIQHDLHDKWQRNSISQRLVYLGGGFGLVTLIFGIGAIVTRGKEQEDA